MTIKHRARSKHKNADALSRIPVSDTCQHYKMGCKLEMLPCKGCTYCQRAHKKWSTFTESVDDMLPSVANSPPTEHLKINQSMTTLDNNKASKVLSNATGDLGPLHGWGYTTKQLSDFQEREEPIKLVTPWCRDNSVPSESVLSDIVPQPSICGLIEETFLVEDGLLWKKSP